MGSSLGRWSPRGLDDDGGSTREASALDPSHDHVAEVPVDTSSSSTASVHTVESHDATTPHNPYTPIDGCAEGSNTPLGQANPSVEPEPMGAVWCYPLAPATEPTRENGENSWVDEFNTNVQMQQLDDGDFGYRVFESAGRTDDHTTQHFINNNHWMTDSSGAFTGGSSMRPDRSFTFEDGVFVIEADVASGVTEYDSDSVGGIHRHVGAGTDLLELCAVRLRSVRRSLDLRLPARGSGPPDLRIPGTRRRTQPGRPR